MATIASLNVLLGLNTAKFTAGSKKAVGTLGGLTSSLRTAGKVAAGFGAILAGVGGGYALSRVVVSAMKTVDALKASAVQAGLTTEALSRLQYAASQNDGSAEAMADAIGKMNQRLGIAAKEGDSVAKALQGLGLSAGTLVNLAPEQAFMEIAEKISKIENPAQRAAAAYEIFGRKGLELQSVLMLGRAGLMAAGAEADKFGISISQVSAEKIGAAVDAIGRMKMVASGLANTLATELAPFIEAASARVRGGKGS